LKKSTREGQDLCRIQRARAGGEGQGGTRSCLRGLSPFRGGLATSSSYPRRRSHVRDFGAHDVSGSSGPNDRPQLRTDFRPRLLTGGRAWRSPRYRGWTDDRGEDGRQGHRAHPRDSRCLLELLVPARGPVPPATRRRVRGAARPLLTCEPPSPRLQAVERVAMFAGPMSGGGLGNRADGPGSTSARKRQRPPVPGGAGGMEREFVRLSRGSSRWSDAPQERHHAARAGASTHELPDAAP